eukprot:224694-Chlamydomonas_euryale.AAC.5
MAPPGSCVVTHGPPFGSCVVTHIPPWLLRDHTWPPLAPVWSHMAPPWLLRGHTWPPLGHFPPSSLGQLSRCRTPPLASVLMTWHLTAAATCSLAEIDPVL